MRGHVWLLVRGRTPSRSRATRGGAIRGKSRWRSEAIRGHSVIMLGAICGSARSMDHAVQSMDPYFAQESMDRAGICGSSCAIHEF